MIRTVVGVVLVLLGGLWISQGSGAMKGSMMSGHGQYTVLGVVVALVGVALIVWRWRTRGRGHDGAPSKE
jgi:protein-S-isoprenylcysteine O-methyltransferase Ste14